MDLYEAIEKRRTIRSFRKAATEEQTRRIILAGAKAPSGGNSQPWEFVSIDDPRMIDQIGELKYRLNRKNKPGPSETQQDVEERALGQKKGFANVSVVAVCTTQGASSAGWLAVENMSLAAVAEGLGSGIIGFWGDEKKEVEKLIGLPEGYELTCIVKLGVPQAEAVPPKQRPEFSWLHKNRF
jgi:nitroreductase